MTTDREQLKNLRIGIAQHFEDAATLFQHLPPEEHELYLTTAVGAWNLVHCIVDLQSISLLSLLGVSKKVEIGAT